MRERYRNRAQRRGGTQQNRAGGKQNMVNNGEMRTASSGNRAGNGIKRSKAFGVIPALPGNIATIVIVSIITNALLDLLGSLFNIDITPSTSQPTAAPTAAATPSATPQTT